MIAAFRPLLPPVSVLCRQTLAFCSKQPPASCDLWSGPEEAEMYVKHIPEYQKTVIPWLVEFYHRRHPDEAASKIPLAIDVFCGNGQLSGVLASHCDRVIGIDISQAQLDLAKKYNGYENVDYLCAPHTDLVTLCGGLKPDVITVGMGVPSFFNCKEFYDAVAQCLRPGGVFGIFGQFMRGDIQGRPEFGRILENLWEERLTLLRQSHSLLKNHYRDVNPPFDDQERREARITIPTSNERMLGIAQCVRKDLRDGDEAIRRFGESLPNLENANMYIDTFGIMAQLH